MPAGVVDRDADVWEPLLVIAELAGGEWLERARVSAVSLVSLSKQSTPSLGVRLLSDIRSVFGDREQILTSELLERLHAVDESPWGDLKGKPLDPRGLARRLDPYGVKPRQVRTLATTGKGYRREDFWDAWTRYLSPLCSSPHVSETSETSGTNDCLRCNGAGCQWCAE
jgi:hypothetical protein